ncbi:hypothetical protein IQ06DRAFT_27050 [Phaeosphaeriaceae sp. SRC1lsM3a]|nr:hypothetical protein IQ06DRAFT_27050 [Stagonospora sp. SRC1lsM3a]
MGCFPSRLRQPDKSHVLRHPADVRVRGRHAGTTRGEHPAVLSYDDACAANYISSGLVTNFLGEEIHPLVEKEDIEQARSLSHEAIKGFVELEWCLENNTQDWHMARFLVTTNADPTYDIVLGKRDGQKYGMGKVKA